jgi:hypothetical protein
MPETHDLPPGLRARLVRGLEAPPLRRPQPWQARFARVARHHPEPVPRARRPRLALVTGALGIVALATLAASVSTGDVDPRIWTGRALNEVRDTFMPAPAAPAPAPRPEVTASPSPSLPAGPVGAAPARARQAPSATPRPTPAPPRRVSTPSPSVPSLLPGVFPIPSPLPTLAIPFSASDFSGHGR